MRWWVLLLVLATSAAATPVDLAVDREVDFSRGYVLTGALDGTPNFLNPNMVDVTRVDLGPGTLRVCPVDAEEDPTEAVDEPDVIPRESICEGGDSFDEPTVTFSLGARVQAFGTYTLAQTNATMMAIGADSVLAMLVAPQVLDLSGNDYTFRAATSTTQVFVRDGDETRTYNGTDFEFTFDGTQADWSAPGIIGAMDLTTIRLRHGSTAAVQDLPDPFKLLNLQAAHYGPEAQDRRTDLARVVREFGRVPDIINGAIYGHLNGTIGNTAMDPDHIVLARFRDIDLDLEGGTMTGDGDLALLISENGIGTGGKMYTARWGTAATLWIIAGVVSIVRMHDVSPMRPRKTMNSIMGLGLLVLIDLWIMDRLAGTSAMTAIVENQKASAIISLITIDAVLWAIVWILFLLPVRRVARKLLPAGWPRWAGDAASWIAILLVIGLAPARLLSTAYVLVRF